VALVAFVLWIAYGVWQWRRSQTLYDRLAEMPAGRRTTLATLLLFGSAVLLMAVIFSVYQASPREIPPWGWGVIILAGLGFVHAQTLAAAMLVAGALRR
jgi:hypothetical protein